MIKIDQKEALVLYKTLVCYERNKQFIALYLTSVKL